MDSIVKYGEKHKEQIVLGRKTSKELVDYILKTLPSTIVPIELINPSICQNFIKTIAQNTTTAKEFIPRVDSCTLIKIGANEYYTDYIENLCKWIYVLVEMQTGEIETNCWKLALALCVYRGISKKGLREKGIEYSIYVNYLKLLNEE